LAEHIPGKNGNINHSFAQIETCAVEIVSQEALQGATREVLWSSWQVIAIQQHDTMHTWVHCMQAYCYWKPAGKCQVLLPEHGADSQATILHRDAYAQPSN
jgi:hypothetical protein